MTWQALLHVALRSGEVGSASGSGANGGAAFTNLQLRRLEGAVLALVAWVLMVWDACLLIVYLHTFTFCLLVEFLHGFTFSFWSVRPRLMLPARQHIVHPRILSKASRGIHHVNNLPGPG